MQVSTKSYLAQVEFYGLASKIRWISTQLGQKSFSVLKAQYCFKLPLWYARKKTFSLWRVSVSWVLRSYPRMAEYKTHLERRILKKLEQKNWTQSKDKNGKKKKVKRNYEWRGIKEWKHRIFSCEAVGVINFWKLLEFCSGNFGTMQCILSGCEITK